MTETWTISAGGRSYGPYSAEQMSGFAAEGRLAPHSLIARSGEEIYQPASEDPEISQLFRPIQAAQEQIAQSMGAEQAPAEPISPSEDTGPQRFGRSDQECSSGERSHFIIVADMKSRSVTGLEEEIFNLGPAYPIVPQAWVLASEMSINEVRNQLIQKVGKLDMLFVVDATHNKAAWFNFGPESDSRIRRIWQKPQDQARRAG